MFISSRDSIRRYAFLLALKIALNVGILAGLIIIRSTVSQSTERLVGVEPQLAITAVLPPIDDSHCNPSFLSLQCMMSMYVTISFAFSLFFLGVAISQDKRVKQAQAVLGIFVEVTFCLATEVVRERIGQLFRTAAYSVKTVKTAWIALHQNLRVRLETMPKYPGFRRACLGVTARLLMITFCLFFLGLAVTVVIPCHHHQPFSKCAQFASFDLPFVALDITDRAETLFNTVLTAFPFLFGLRFLVCSLLSSIAFISYHHMKARPKSSLLINDDEKQDIVNHEDERPVESDKDIICDVDDGDVSSQVQEAISVPNNGKEDGLDQRSEAAINRLPSATEDPKHANSAAIGPPVCVAPVRSKSLQHQQQTRPYRSSLSASSQEFVPRFRNRAIGAPAHNYCPPHWAPAPPVSVRITAPVKPGTHQQNAEMIVSSMALARLRGTPELPVHL